MWSGEMQSLTYESRGHLLTRVTHNAQFWTAADRSGVLAPDLPRDLSRTSAIRGLARQLDLKLKSLKPLKSN